MSDRDSATKPSRPPLAHPVLYRFVRASSPFWRPLAGHRFFPMWAVLRHRGRRSGREYAVPVGVRETSDGYFIGLPFGAGTQWVQNVLAAGGCTVRRRGEDVALVNPTLVALDEGAFAFPAWWRWLMRISGVQYVMRFRRGGDQVGDPEARRAVSQPGDRHPSSAEARRADGAEH